MKAVSEPSRIDMIEADMPDTRAFFDQHFAGWPRQLAACFLVALLYRAATFGDPAVHIDESFYFLVGQRMHLGELPYVDLWDRKPFGLFALFYLFAALSPSVLAYQIAALVCAALAGFVIIRTAAAWTRIQGAVLAGLSYIVLLNTFQGIGGQSPVYYNLLIASAALAIIRSLHDLHAGRVPASIYVAMSLCGIALTLKQTTLFEAVFFGLFVAVTLARSGAPFPWLKVAALVLLGSAPTLGVAAFYYLSGHWSEFWHAMVTSNLAKRPATAMQYVQRSIKLTMLLWPILLLVVLSFKALAKSPRAQPYRSFLLGWTIAAIIGFASIQNLYVHYCLPLLVPFTAVAAMTLDRRMIGPFAFFIMAGFAMLESEAYNLTRHRENARNMNVLAQLIRDHSPNGTFLAYDAPPMLFALSSTRPSSPLLFPNHFNHEIERDVSHLNTSAELRRVLAAKPGAVGIASRPRVFLYNRESLDLVGSYVQDHCEFVGSALTYEIGREDSILIYGGCT